MTEARSGIESVSPRAPARSQARRGFVSGVLATMIMSLALLLGMAMGGELLPRPVPVAVMEAIFGAWVPVLGILVLAVVAHLLYGGLWASALAVAREPVTDGKGVSLGLFLWLIEQLIVVPLLGWGVFGSSLVLTIGATSFVFAGTSFLFHLIYGLTVGMLLSKEMV